MVQNFTIALITIGFIVNLLKTLVALKKAVKKKNSNGFCLACDKNQRENNLELKNAAFYSFSRRRNIHLKKKTKYHENNFDWIFVKTLYVRPPDN